MLSLARVPWLVDVDGVVTRRQLDPQKVSTLRANDAEPRRQMPSERGEGGGLLGCEGAAQACEMPLVASFAKVDGDGVLRRECSLIASS